MNIGVDESGTFVYSNAQNSWNCVAAYVYPEIHSRPIKEEVSQIIQHYAKAGQKEVKLRDLDEAQYVDVLVRLRKWDGVLYAVATNAAANTPEVVNQHQDEQTRRILESMDKMLYESGREGLRTLARRVSELPHQLYIQMISQVRLVIQIVNSAILYFVQRYPATLRRFRWRIDQKNSTRTSYEEAYLQVLPAMLQSVSLRDPMPMLKGADYRALDRFYFSKGDKPSYLRDTYGIDIGDNDDRALNIGQLVGEDVRFIDSKSDASVQVADLLVSGLRRCLRGQFQYNDQMASLIGSLMVQGRHNNVPVKLISLGTEEREVHGGTYSALRRMRESSRAMRVC